MFQWYSRKKISTNFEQGVYYHCVRMVPMVLNPQGIEPTFLKLDSWLPVADFIPIITFNALKYKKRKEKISFTYTKII